MEKGVPNLKPIVIPLQTRSDPGCRLGCGGPHHNGGSRDVLDKKCRGLAVLALSPELRELRYK